MSAISMTMRSQIIVTANEIHIPVGRPVMIRGTSQDVIHSFWVPGLFRANGILSHRASRLNGSRRSGPGRFRGQCAEFCGLQHAHMALVGGRGSTGGNFNSWRTAQLQNAAACRNTPSEQRGQQVFLETACALCHTIRGTTAAGQVAPGSDARREPHQPSRPARFRTIAAIWRAGFRIRRRSNPEITWRRVPLQSEELQPLLDYLEILQ